MFEASAWQLFERRRSENTVVREKDDGENCQARTGPCSGNERPCLGQAPRDLVHRGYGPR